MRQNEEILFKNWQWGECLDYLNNIVQHSDNIVLLSGCHDSGKTTLKQELISLLPDHFKTFSMNVNIFLFCLQYMLMWGKFRS